MTESALALWTADGEIYAYPFSTSPFGMFVNNDVIKAAGQQTPAPGRRIVAIGDVHGAFDQLVGILQTAGLIDANRRWSGGTAILVQTGLPGLGGRGTIAPETLEHRPHPRLSQVRGSVIGPRTCWNALGRPPHRTTAHAERSPISERL